MKNVILRKKEESSKIYRMTYGYAFERDQRKTIK